MVNVHSLSSTIYPQEFVTGTSNQIELAEQIKPRVAAEFERVAGAFADAASRQPAEARTDTQAIIAMVYEKRDQVLGNDQAGYFIREWQELGDQVRQMIARDPRYQAIKARRRPREI